MRSIVIIIVTSVISLSAMAMNNTMNIETIGFPYSPMAVDNNQNYCQAVDWKDPFKKGKNSYKEYYYETKKFYISDKNNEEYSNLKIIYNNWNKDNITSRSVIKYKTVRKSRSVLKSNWYWNWKWEWYWNYSWKSSSNWWSSWVSWWKSWYRAWYKVWYSFWVTEYYNATESYSVRLYSGYFSKEERKSRTIAGVKEKVALYYGIKKENGCLIYNRGEERLKSALVDNTTLFNKNRVDLLRSKMIYHPGILDM